jgi:hypothetical protein
VRRHLPDWKLVTATAAIATIASVSLAVSTPASMNVDGQHVVSDVAPVTTPGGAYLPIRAISEAAGGITTFDPATGEIVVERGPDTLKMKLGSKDAVFNGQAIQLAHAPFTVRGRTMVPSAVIATAFGSTVHYDARRAKVDVRTPGVVVAGAPDDSP